MAAPHLAEVLWPTAIEAAQSLPSATSASVLSIAALFTHDFENALSHVREAARREPLNPVHEFRRAMLLARFGDLRAASTRLEWLKERLPDVPLIDYLRALFALRGGAPDKARAIAGTLETTFPNFIQGKFLRAEVQIVLAGKPATAEKYLMSLPTGSEWESLWADLLVKLIFLHAQTGPAMAQKYLEKKLSKEGPARSLVLKAMSWVQASVEELVQHIANEPARSRGEALALECLVEKLNLGKREAALVTLRALLSNYPERPAIRRIYDVFLTRTATDLSAAGRHIEALRFVEKCLRDQPQDTVYHQNRAAIFTLLREPGPYHEAWAALNAHQYRLALLGAFDASALAQIVKTHRLFAQHARGSTGVTDRMTRGIFRLVESESGEKPRVVTNVDEIAADPDLLRQWIHHTRAELLFRHAMLGEDGYRALLDPEDRDEAMARADALDSLSDSLRLLVPEEGSALAKALVQRWRKLAATVRTRYRAPDPKKTTSDSATAPAESGEGEEADTAPASPIQSESDLLKQEHLQVLADLCLICLQWSPQYGQLWIAEELLEFTQSEIAFLDEKVLRQAQRSSGYDTPYAIQVLANRIRTVTGVEKGQLTDTQKKHVVETCMAELLRTMAWCSYGGHSGNAKESAVKAIIFVDRARSLNPTDADIELTAAKLFSLGEYFEESRQALERFRRLVEPDNQKAIEDADKIDELLRERRKEGKAGERRSRTLDVDQAVQGSEFRIKELENDLDRCPTAWRLYNDLAKELAVAGRFDEAIQMADRSVGQCLNRAEQMNARGLAIEARGMKKLAATNPRAARLYAVGAHEPARKALEAVCEHQQLDYTLLYLLGRCELAAGLPNEARESFKKSEEVCDRQLHRTVLRNLTENIDNAYLAVARASIDNALQDGSMEEALEQAAAVFARLQAPAAWIVDFARVYYSVAVSRVGASGAAPPAVVKVEAQWQERMLDALAKKTDAERALALAMLAEEVHPGSVKQARLLKERTLALQQRIAAVGVLNQAGALLGAKKFAATLDFLKENEASTGSEPRFLRINALALLGLHRFDEADMVVEQIGTGGSAEVRDFVAHYPALVFRQRLGIAQELLREAKASEANRVLAGAIPASPKDELDLAYCRAFATALEGYDFRRSKQRDEARRRFLSAMSIIEPQLSVRSGDDQRHVLELYDRLEKEVESYAG